MIKQYITEGKIVPMEVTIKLLENAMREAMAQDKSANKFLIDGFPRQMDQAIKFDASVSRSKVQIEAGEGAKTDCPLLRRFALRRWCCSWFAPRLLSRSASSSAARPRDVTTTMLSQSRSASVSRLKAASHWRPQSAWKARAAWGHVTDARLVSTTAETFIETSMPVVDYYRKQKKVVDVSKSPF